MKRITLPVIASLALVVAPMLLPAVAPAQAFRGGRGGGPGMRSPIGHMCGPIGRIPIGGGAAFGGGPVGHKPFGPHGFASHHRFHHRRFPFGFVGVYAAPWFAYSAPYPFYDSTPYGYGLPYDPPAYYNPPAYYDSPAYYDPPAVSAPPRSRAVTIAPPPAPPPPPRPAQVQFPTGRYEMMGDGLRVPFRWVWIPNPPSSPPSFASPGAAPPPGDPPSTRRSELYRWTDEDGVLHMTDRLDSVPQQYRSRLKQSS